MRYEYEYFSSLPGRVIVIQGLVQIFNLLSFVTKDGLVRIRKAPPMQTRHPDSMVPFRHWPLCPFVTHPAGYGNMSLNHLFL
jgi:hypothetical protein